jgi:hypothetical protein
MWVCDMDSDKMKRKYDEFKPNPHSTGPNDGKSRAYFGDPKLVSRVHQVWNVKTSDVVWMALHDHFLHACPTTRLYRVSQKCAIGELALPLFSTSIPSLVLRRSCRCRFGQHKPQLALGFKVSSEIRFTVVQFLY